MCEWGWNVPYRNSRRVKGAGARVYIPVIYGELLGHRKGRVWKWIGGELLGAIRALVNKKELGLKCARMSHERI